jgi:hypothetical protein
MAGPILIVSSVVAVLHDFAFGGLISRQQIDVLAYFLPTHCLLGRSLASGHIPAWNPSLMTGLPFAADPQSGWAYLLPSVLYSTMSCGAAIRWFVIAQPLIAGLGLYAFLRSEGLSRAAAALGGLSMALGLLQAKVALELPFSAALAWTAVLLASASRLMQARTWSRRMPWVTVTALVWGQLASAHLSDGQLIGSAALLLYLLVKTPDEIRSRRLLVPTALFLAGLLAVALIAVNLAVLLPRSEYLPQTSLSQGYLKLVQFDRAASGGENPDREGRAMPTPWPLKFSTAPGAFFGATVLVLSFAALWNRRRRRLAAVLVLYLVMAWILSTQAVADLLGGELRGIPLADQLYIHQPWRFGLALFLLVPILAAIGLEAWLDDGGLPRRLSMLAPGIAVWGFLPIAAGIPLVLLERLFVGGLGGAVALLVVAVRPGLATVIPLLVGVELTAAALAGQAVTMVKPIRPGFYKLGSGMPSGFVPLLRPTVDAAAYVAKTPFSRRISQENSRYLTYGGYHPLQSPSDWPALADGRAMLFNIEDAQIYNPAQPVGYWRFVRAENSGARKPAPIKYKGRAQPVKYNLSFFVHPKETTMDLLGVGWVIANAKQSPRADWKEIGREGKWILYKRDSHAPRAAVFRSWVSSRFPELALRRLVSSDFDPETLIVEGAGANVVGGATKAIPATYRELGAEHAVIEASSPTRGMLLVRNTYDPNWHASVDGHPAPIITGDYFLQAIPIPPGTHTIDLTYDDPWIGIGLAGSAFSLLALLGATVFLSAKERRSSSPPIPWKQRSARASPL